jgi:hypothetical protein
MGVATVLLGCLLAPQPGWGEDPPVDSAWGFDVRVVRVEMSAEQMESAPTWPQPIGDSATGAAWPEMLSVLKRRGATRIMMDRSSTSADGQEARVTLHRERSALVVQSRSNPGGAVQTPVPSREAVDVAVTPGPTARYEVEVAWVDDRLVRDGEPLPGERATWRGRAPPLDRSTLVLRHAQQIPGAQGALVGTELYVFLTLRRVTGR